MEKRYLLALIFTVLLFVTIPSLSAISIDDIIQNQKQKQWYVGDNLNPGDSFTYRICDDKTFTRSYFAEQCYTIQLDFYHLLDGPAGKTWIVQSLISTDEFTRSGIFQINASTFEITTDYYNLEFSKSVEKTLFEIREFASPASPKILQVGQLWGTVPSYFITDAEVVVIYEDVIKTGQEEFKVFVIGYNVKEQSTYSISKQFPFPLSGDVYSTTVIYPEPDFLFSFELLKYQSSVNNASIVFQDIDDFRFFDNPVSLDVLVSSDLSSTDSDDLICIPRELWVSNSVDSIIIDGKSMTEVEQRKYFDDIEFDTEIEN